MGLNSKINWCDDSWNLWLGCEKISPACANCYAEGWAKRSGLVKWGKAAERRRTSAATWNQVERFARLAEAEGRPRRVFVNSLSDLFEDNPQVADWRAEAFERFKRYPMLQFLLLTKRANNIAPSLPADWGSGYPNVWLGCTVENQEQADKRIPELLKIPAKVRFLSCEPLLGPVEIGRWLCCARCGRGEAARQDAGGTWFHQTGNGCFPCATPETGRGPSVHNIDWCIAGGESGPNARPMHPDWARSLRDQCQAAGVAFYFKQHGEWRHGFSNVIKCIAIGDDLFTKLGKKAAGRILDGREHNEFPRVEASQ